LVAEKDKYRFYFKSLFEFPENLSEEERICFLVKEGAKVLEEEILLYPDQWLNPSLMW